MSAWAKPGVKCVCIRTMAEAGRVSGGVYPAVGQVYTVRAVVITTIGKNAGNPSILLEEITNSPNINERVCGVNSSLEPAMPISAFRPLITKTQEQDVALFRHILDGLPVGEVA